MVSAASRIRGRYRGYNLFRARHQLHNGSSRRPAWTWIRIHSHDDGIRGSTDHRIVLAIYATDYHMKILKLLIAGCVLTLFGAAHVQHARTLSIFFEENRGQAGPDFRFLARGGGDSLAFAPPSTTVAPRHSGKQISFRTEFAAATPNAAIRGEETQAAKVHYFRGHSADA